MNWLQAAKERRDRLIADQDDRLKEEEAQREELVEQVEHKMALLNSYLIRDRAMNDELVEARSKAVQVPNMSLL